MSMSRSPSPKRVTDITPESRVSRSDTLARTSIISASEGRQLPAEALPTSSSSPERSTKSTRQRPAEEVASDQPMAKKIRIQSDDKKRNANSSSSPSSSSQGMPESEMDADRSQQSEPSLPPPPAPLKKKRTRTLTTPHQSAVLHALLAQSRFPTTAMREEVGRSIGLSARKVQIWFQNQRQKARRPSNQSQSSALLTRPTQYGSFSSGPSSTLAITNHPAPSRDPGVGPSVRASNIAPSSADEPSLKQRGYNLPESHIERGSQLLGPGMPGSDIVSGGPFRGRDLPIPARTTSERVGHHYSPSDIPHTAPPTEGRTYLSPRPSSAHISRGHSRQRSFSRTLPPLVFDGPHHRSSFSAPGPGGLYSSSPTPLGSSSFHTPFRMKNSPSPESPFAHQMPDPQPRLHPVGPTAFSRALPPSHLRPYPPSLLSPPLHSRTASWSGRSSFSLLSSPAPGPSPLATFTRPSSSSTSRPRSISPPPRKVVTPEPQVEDDAAGPPPSARLGRYDPVRAAFIPLRQSPPPKNISPSPPAQSAKTDDRSPESSPLHGKE